MANAKGFGKQLTKFVERDVKHRSEKAYREIVAKLGSDLISRTPYLTGRARGNWYFTTTRPSASFNPEARGAAGSASRARLLSTVGRLKLNTPVYITNNTPYIRKLNAGSSTQAPAKFVEMALEKYRFKQIK